MQKQKQKPEKVIPKPVINCTKYCKSCHHLVTCHRFGGCQFVTECSEAEDHYRCDCTCEQCIHRTEYTLKQLQEALDVDGQH